MPSPDAPPPAPACANCGLRFERGDAFCARCGWPSGQIDWSLSADRSPGRGLVHIRPGERFFLVARNRGFAAARVEVELSAAGGVRLAGSAARHVPPGQAGAFELAHLEEAALEGSIRLRSKDGPRSEWWERQGWRTRELRLPLHVRVREERWIAGSPVVLFPPGVRAQYARVFNDAEKERPLVTTAPAGYRATCLGVPVGQAPPAAGGGESLELALQPLAAPGDAAADREWSVSPETERVPLVRLAAARSRPDAGPDVVVAIDFGTRNTGVRVRWRRTLLPGKPAGTVDVVGDRPGAARFPTQMVLHQQERTFRWGTDAAEMVAASRMTAEEVPVVSLKTYLREGQERFTQWRPEWTNEELVGRYFERIIQRLDDYFRTAEPGRPLARAGLGVRYVVSRPVLDANEGDEKGRRYERALQAALVRCGVPEEAITFVLEPVAAAVGIARRREAELLALPEGTAVAVIDSGGGTTDVTLGRARLEGGTVSLDLAGSYALRLGPDNPAVAALERYGAPDRREVGGDVLDWLLAYQLSARAAELLESEGRPLPRSLWQSAAPGGSPALEAARLRQFILVCRTMKERFAHASTIYLNRPTGAPREKGEVLPFPNREELQGVYLVHALYDEQILAPTLTPVVAELVGRIGSAAGPGSIRPSEVRRVFYVGGTNVDPFVRQHFGRAFPLAAGDADPDAQGEARIAERLHAVVEGAVWYDEQLFAPSPLALAVRLRSREESLMREGGALQPAGVASPRFLTETLDPGEELDASLVASGGGLPDPVVVARAFHRNEGPERQEVSLILVTTRERGAEAELQAGSHRRPQWRFSLLEPEA